MYKKIFLILILLVTMVFSVSAEVYELNYHSCFNFSSSVLTHEVSPEGSCTSGGQSVYLTDEEESDGKVLKALIGSSFYEPVDGGCEGIDTIHSLRYGSDSVIRFYSTEVDVCLNVSETERYYFVIVGEGSGISVTANLTYPVITNTEPVINSISPSTRVELKQGETQLYTANVTDAEGDATYSWEVGGVEVSTSETYTADWDNIEAGIYTLRLTVSDTEYSDTTTQTLEIRAVGGSPSSGSSGGSTITTTTSIDDNSEETTKIQPKQQNVFEKILEWFKNLFRRG